MMLLLALLVVTSCQACMNDTELLWYLEKLIASDEWTHIEQTLIITDTTLYTTLELTRDPQEVLSQFKSVELVSVGERNMLTFLGSTQADFILRIDSATADDVIDEVAHKLIPATDDIVCSKSTLRYRTIDGSCNNLDQPEWGMAQLPLRRFIPSAYEDGKKVPRTSSTGQALPSAREVSIGVTDEDSELVASIYSSLNVHFGQLLSHDLDLVPQTAGECSGCEKSDICLPIVVPSGDPVFNDSMCIAFIRSTGIPSQDGDQPWAYQQPNIITSYLDASFIYGSSVETLNTLRVPGDPQGLMRVTPNPLGMDLLPPDNEIAHCAGREGPISCGKAGDLRAAEQIGLTSLHTVWLREHNRIARTLSLINPHWNGDTVFNEARKVVGAEWQHIVYNEYLPLLVGQRVARHYGLDVNLEYRDTSEEHRYDPTVDATIHNGFATAALRFGHSQVPTTIWRVDTHFERVFSDINMKEAFFNATHIYDAQGGGPDSVLKGTLVQPLSKVDNFFSSSVSKHLFEDPKEGFGLDLIALNIQRGRDHGLPGYVRFREDVCGLEPIRNWTELAYVVPSSIASRLSDIYSSVDDIDPFVGFFAESHLPGAFIGPTLACLIGRQFSYSKHGDRFWYENTDGYQAFSDDQQKEIRKASMARVLCDNTDDLDEIQPFAFLLADDNNSTRVHRRGGYHYASFVEYSKYNRYPDLYGRLEGFTNHRASCKDETSIPNMDLRAWAEY